MNHYMQMPCGVWLRKLDLSSPRIAAAESIGLVYLESNLSIALSVEMFLFVFVFVCGSVQISNFITSKSFFGHPCLEKRPRVGATRDHENRPEIHQRKRFFLSSPRRCEKKTSRQAFAKQETAKSFCLSSIERWLRRSDSFSLPHYRF